MEVQRARNVSFSNYYLHSEAVERTVRQARARRRPCVQIMKGYHCSSDSVNLRALHTVCLYQDVCMLCAAYVYFARLYGGRGAMPLTLNQTKKNGPTNGTVYLTWLTVDTSHSFLKTILKLGSLPLVPRKHWDRLSAIKIVFFAIEGGGEEKGGKKAQSSPTFFVPGFFLFFFPLPI